MLEDEGGAIAIIVALFAVVMIVLTAFAVDIGNAYAQKRQLSVSADAAALAAAASVGEAIPSGVACTQTMLDSLTANGHTGATAIAKATADAMNTANNKTGTNEPVKSVTVSCAKMSPTDAEDNAVEVTVDTGRTVDTAFAGVIGVGSLDPGSYAVARYVRVRSTGGLKPWALCVGVRNDAEANKNITFWTAIDKNIGPCDTEVEGDRGGVDFDSGSNDVGDLADWTSDGYPGPVTIPSIGADAIEAFPGGKNSILIRDAFENDFVDHAVLLPLVTGFTPGTNPGANGTFDVVGIASVYICGVRYNKVSYPGNCWETPSPPVLTPSTSATTTGSIDKNSTVLTVNDAAFTTPPLYSVVTVTVAGAGSGGSVLTSTVESYDTLSPTTKVTLEDKASKEVTDAEVTIETSVPTGGFGPYDDKGDLTDHIQFRWINFVPGSYAGAPLDTCDSFTDELCAGVTTLWR